MPVKLGGGRQMQEYDPSNGRYGCGSSGRSHAYVKSELLFANYASIGGDKKTSKIMPNYKKSVTPDEKFIKYSLDKDNPVGKHKAVVYEKVLGFTKENYHSLKNQIHESIVSGKAKLVNISKNTYGDIKYQYIINIKGTNGRTADVVAVYGVNKKNGKPRMITNYVK